MVWVRVVLEFFLFHLLRWHRDDVDSFSISCAAKNLIQSKSMPRKTRTWSVAENGSEVLREDPTRVEEALDLRRVQESIVGTTFVDVNVRQRKKERISRALEKMHEAQSEFQVIRDVINLLELGDTLLAVPSEKQSIDHERQHEEAIVTEGRIEKQFKSAAENMRRAADCMRRRAQGKSKFYEEVER